VHKTLFTFYFANVNPQSKHTNNTHLIEYLTCSFTVNVVLSWKKHTSVAVVNAANTLLPKLSCTKFVMFGTTLRYVYRKGSFTPSE